jgi:hypothetical protein
MILPDLKRTKGRGPQRFRATLVRLSMTRTTAAVEAWSLVRPAAFRLLLVQDVSSRNEGAYGLPKVGLL